MRIHQIMFALLAAAVTAAFLWVVAPYAGAILWSVVFAILFTPAKDRLSASLGGRNSLASLLMLLAIIVLIIVPAFLLVSLVLGQAVQIYQNASAHGVNLNLFADELFEALPQWAQPMLQHIGLGSRSEAQATVSAAVSGALSALVSSSFSIGQSAFPWVIAFCVALYLTYFLLRGGPRLADQIGETVPLDRRTYDALCSRFASVIRATIKGSLLVALAQGISGGLIFALLGIPAAPLWGTLIGAMSLVPAVGTAIVWVPVALYLLLTGSIADGVILIACGTLVIGTIDNFLRPILIGRETRMPDPLVLISTLGGIAVVGVNGLILGPVIAALFVSVWSMTRRSPAGPSSLS
jgi:predicted PurR-regulated permease PerM